MARKFAFLLAIFLGVFFIACSATNDAKITAEVKTKITDDEKLDATNIDVDTKNGVVTLQGKVVRDDQEAHAIQIARSVPNVKDVISNLQVEPQVATTDLGEKLEDTAETTGEKIEDTAEKAGEKIEETAEKVGDKVEDVNVGEVVDDASTTAKVKMALAKDDQVAAYRIDVDTKNGVVTLTGKVKSPAEETRAIEVAKAIEGVKSVNSDLTVGSY